MCFTLFSMILGPFPQGLWMGILNASGSLARACGPLVISNLYANYGPRTVFAFVAALNVRPPVSFSFCFLARGPAAPTLLC